MTGLFRNDRNWCGVCEERPEIVITTFSNSATRNEKITCKKCGATLSVSNWDRNIRCSD